MGVRPMAPPQKKREGFKRNRRQHGKASMDGRSDVKKEKQKAEKDRPSFSFEEDDSLDLLLLDSDMNSEMSDERSRFSFEEGELDLLLNSDSETELLLKGKVK